jgi:putative ABC transport system permease protein
MYIVKNAYLNIIRGKGRNILIGIIITAITISACVALTINKSGTTLVDSYRYSNPVEISFTLNSMNFRDATEEERANFQTLDIDQVKYYGDSTYVSDYYYTLETTISIENVAAVTYDEINGNTNQSGGFGGRQIGSIGDFRLSAYSDSAYINDFVEGIRKIIDGVMIDKDSTDKVIVISEELALENGLKIGDKVNIYSPNNEEEKYEFEIIGIFEDNNEIQSNGFMNMNAMNSSNQIFTNINSVDELLDDTTNTNGNIMRNSQGLTAKYYLNNIDDITNFEQEVRSKGLNNLYAITTNESATLEKIKPIENLSNFSFSFLIVILLVGGLVLGIINMINIRERKYEIGVLRAIGMSKKKVATQLITEIFIVAIISLAIGTTIGTILSQPVTNQMLKQEITSYEEKISNQQNNFGPGNFNRAGFGRVNPAFNRNNQPTDYISLLEVNVDIITIIQLMIVSLFLTVISGLISVMFVNKYEPNKILQNRA